MNIGSLPPELPAKRPWWKRFLGGAGKVAKNAGGFALEHPEIMGSKVGTAVAIGKILTGGVIRETSKKQL